MNTNTYTPSKKLFIEVTGINECLVDYIQEREGFIKYGNAVYQEVNIYELAIKTKQKYPSLDLNLAATDISEFWRQANELVRGANNE